MSFSATIKGVSGEIYAHVFENPAQGVGRSLYWAISIDCEPATIDGEEWDIGVSCEWIHFPVTQWTELDGQALSQNDSAQASFYLAEHHPMLLKSLSLIRSDHSPMFRVQLSGTFDLRGFGSLDATGIPLAIDCPVRFAGVYVVPDNLTPKPSNASAVLDAVSKHISLSGLSVPVWDRFRYVLEPDASYAP